jgi:aryl-alcohol dehydrogenase-like predicted oxidoreductase
VGARTPAQVALNAEASAWDLPEEAVRRIDQAYQRIFTVDNGQKR